jgi:hypothetical protein
VYRRFVVFLLVAACGGGKKAAAPAVPDAEVALPAVEAPTRPPKPDPTFPSGTRSLRLTRTVAVRIAPGDQEHQIGTIAIDTRVGWTDVQPGPGCKKKWVEITPRGWVCGEFLEANPRQPLGIELPRLDRGAVVPGTYGKVVEEGAMIYGLPDETAGHAKKGGKKKPAPPDAAVAVDAGVPNDAGVPDPEHTVVKVFDPMQPVRAILGSFNFIM